VGSNESSFQSSSIYSSGSKNESQKGQKKRYYRSSALRKIMRKLKQQKRQSKLIEKIFVSKKQSHEDIKNRVVNDPLIPKPKILEDSYDC